MAGSEREPTTGELLVMLQGIKEMLLRLEGNVATKEFVDAKFDAHSERTVRLEEDLKSWTKTSTEAHVELDNKISKLDIKMEGELDLLEEKVNTRFEKQEEAQRQDRAEVKSVKNSRVTAWVGIGLAFITNLIFWYVTSGSGGQ